MPEAGTPASDTVRDAVPAGSLRHLAVLFSGSPDRPLLEAVYAYDAELRRIVQRSSHEAAHARLQWWRGELDRLAGGCPSHPRAKALLPLRGRRGLDLALLHEMLVAADLDLVRLTYQSWQELDAYLFRSAGAPQTLIATVLAGERGLAPAEREFARRLGAAVRQERMLRDLPQDLARGRLYAPLQALDAAGLDPLSFGRVPDTAGAAFVTDWRERVRRELDSLPGLLADPAHRQAQRHGLVLAELHGRRLRNAHGPAGSPRDLGPLARLWTAWRTAVRHG